MRPLLAFLSLVVKLCSAPALAASPPLLIQPLRAPCGRESIHAGSGRAMDQGTAPTKSLPYRKSGAQAARDMRSGASNRPTSSRSPSFAQRRPACRSRLIDLLGQEGRRRAGPCRPHAQKLGHAISSFQPGLSADLLGSSSLASVSIQSPTQLPASLASQTLLPTL